MSNYDDNIISTIKTNLKKTTYNTQYNGWKNRTLYGYHSFNIENINISGQRQPLMRLEKIKKHYDFTNKTLIDFGCNTGGMIFHLPELKKAHGLDYDKYCIDSCNYMASVLRHNTEYNFIQQDLNNFNFKNSFEKVDVIFLLSLGSWVKHWKQLYNDCVIHSETIIFETNNDNEGRAQLDFFKELNCTIKLISSSSDDDTTGNYGRKTYLIN